MTAYRVALRKKSLSTTDRPTSPAVVRLPAAAVALRPHLIGSRSPSMFIRGSESVFA
jgi:hypothetical protein